MTHKRCGAHARTTGCPCKARPLANGRCKLHGGKSTGPKTAEGKQRIAEGQYRRHARKRAAEVGLPPHILTATATAVVTYDPDLHRYLVTDLQGRARGYRATLSTALELAIQVPPPPVPRQRAQQPRPPALHDVIEVVPAEFRTTSRRQPRVLRAPNR